MFLVTFHMNLIILQWFSWSWDLSGPRVYNAHHAESTFHFRILAIEVVFSIADSLPLAQLEESQDIPGIDHWNHWHQQALKSASFSCNNLFRNQQKTLNEEC